MSYTSGYNYTTIPTDKEGEELNELVSQKLNLLTNYIIEENEEELKKLDDGEELLDVFYDDVETKNKANILETLQEVVKVVGNNINLSSNTEESSHFCYYPLTTLFSPLMNEDWVINHSMCEDSREGVSGVVTLLTPSGEFIPLNNSNITLNIN